MMTPAELPAVVGTLSVYSTSFPVIVELSNDGLGWLGLIMMRR